MLTMGVKWWQTRVVVFEVESEGLGFLRGTWSETDG